MLLVNNNSIVATYTHMVQIAIPYAYGCTICIYAYGIYVPYAYGMKYVYGTQQIYVLQNNNFINPTRLPWLCEKTGAVALTSHAH